MEYTAKQVAKGLAPATINKHLREICSVLSYATDWSSLAVLEQYYTGDVDDVYRQAMERIAKATA